MLANKDRNIVNFDYSYIIKNIDDEFTNALYIRNLKTNI